MTKSEPVTSFTIPSDHPALAGHFPGDPLVPGSMIMDHVLAAARKHGMYSGAKLNSVKFRSKLLAEQTCDISFSNTRRGLCATCTHDERVVLTCVFAEEIR